MAKRNRLRTLNAIKDLGLVPLFNHPDPVVGQDIVRACVEGGATVVEMTNRGDRSIDLFQRLAELRDRELPDLILGVGTVCNGPTAAQYMNAGADFVVSPTLDEDTARICNTQKVPYLPGCGSVTEIHHAHLLGVEICKIFPAGEVGGPGFIKAVLAPCPWAELMPSGGVTGTMENLRSWFDAGAACVGMGSNLLRKDLIQARDYQGLTRIVRETLGLIRQIRGG